MRRSAVVLPIAALFALLCVPDLTGASDAGVTCQPSIYTPSEDTVMAGSDVTLTGSCLDGGSASSGKTPQIWSDRGNVHLYSWTGSSIHFLLDINAKPGQGQLYLQWGAKSIAFPFTVPKYIIPLDRIRIVSGL